MCSEELAASSFRHFSNVFVLETITELLITVLDNFQSILNLAVAFFLFSADKEQTSRENSSEASFSLTSHNFCTHALAGTGAKFLFVY